MTLTRNELQDEFKKALQAPTSGSQAARVFKILYELIPEEKDNEIYKEVEMIATEMGNYDHSEFLLKMLSERFEILTGDYVRHRQMEADEARERQWENPFWTDGEPDNQENNADHMFWEE